MGRLDVANLVIPRRSLADPLEALSGGSPQNNMSRDTIFQLPVVRDTMDALLAPNSTIDPNTTTLLYPRRKPDPSNDTASSIKARTTINLTLLNHTQSSSFPARAPPSGITTRRTQYGEAYSS